MKRTDIPVAWRPVVANVHRTTQSAARFASLMQNVAKRYVSSNSRGGTVVVSDIPSPEG